MTLSCKMSIVTRGMRKEFNRFLCEWLLLFGLKGAHKANQGLDPKHNHRFVSEILVSDPMHLAYCHGLKDWTYRTLAPLWQETKRTHAKMEKKKHIEPGVCKLLEQNRYHCGFTKFDPFRQTSSFRLA